MHCGLTTLRFLFVGIVVLLLVSGSALSQSVPPFAPDKMDTVLYGAAYYSEYMPYERLDKDVELMQKAGINVVRIGESSWGLWEPEDGRFEYAAHAGTCGDRVGAATAARRPGRAARSTDFPINFATGIAVCGSA